MEMKRLTLFYIVIIMLLSGCSECVTEVDNKVLWVETGAVKLVGVGPSAVPPP